MAIPFMCMVWGFLYKMSLCVCIGVAKNKDNLVIKKQFMRPKYGGMGLKDLNSRGG